MNNSNIRTPDLSTDIGGLRLANPVMTASGTFGYGIEFADIVDVSRIGAVIVKGTTLAPRQGNPYPRMAETPSGMLNAVGLQNKGVEFFIEHIYPVVRNLGTPVVVNVSGATIDDYTAVCHMLAPLEGIAAVEVNISCPNVRQGGMAFGTSCAGAAAVTAATRRAWNRTLIVKLSPNVTDITEIARAAEAEGADCVSLTNTFLGMAIDVERQRPVLSTITGGLSGPAIRPIALRMVWQTAHAVKIPVIGIGGIDSADAALQFIMAGASAVEIGTANFTDPAATMHILDGISDYMVRHGITSLADIRGII